MGMHSEAELNRKFLETSKLMNIYLNHFPAHEKYALSQHIRDVMYGTYELIVEAQKVYHRKTVLRKLDIRHEQWRMLINLAHSLEYFEFKDGKRDQDGPKQTAIHRYTAISRLIDELGRMIGGWLIHEQQREVS